MEEYWDKAVSYETYKKNAEERILNPANDEEGEKKGYYELGLQRMHRMEKVFKPSAEDLESLESKNFEGKILIITEAWCGDASQAVPVIDAFFKDKNEVKIFYRDSDHSLIDQFLTNGAQGIPIVILLNEDFSVKNSWGPRPKYGKELLKKFKENPETYSREAFYSDLQVYYSKNRGKDTLDEILNLL
ncbi:MAG: thioredoxin family protein [Chryseobacterium sp.]|nr:thioredoxin family protein [Chryseobacterium sp.]